MLEGLSETKGCFYKGITKQNFIRITKRICAALSNKSIPLLSSFVDCGCLNSAAILFSKQLG